MKKESRIFLRPISVAPPQRGRLALSLSMGTSYVDLNIVNTMKKENNLNNEPLEA